MLTPTLSNCSFLINLLELHRIGAIAFKKKMLPRANLVISASLWVQGVHALRCAAAQLNGRWLGARQFSVGAQPARSDAPSPEH